MADTTDHYLRSIAYLEEVAADRESLRMAYAASHQDRPLIADLHQRIGLGARLAEIHANLAVRQELREIAVAVRPVPVVVTV